MNYTNIFSGAGLSRFASGVSVFSSDVEVIYFMKWETMEGWTHYY